MTTFTCSWPLPDGADCRPGSTHRLRVEVSRTVDALAADDGVRIVGAVRWTTTDTHLVASADAAREVAA